MCIMRNCHSSTYNEYCKPSSTFLYSESSESLESLNSYPESFSLPVVGTGYPTDFNCGRTKLVLKCSNSSHPPIFKPYNCSSPMCPDCYKYWISSATDRIVSHLISLYQPIKYDKTDLKSEKLFSRYSTLSKHPFRHWTLSFPGRVEKDAKPYDILKRLGELQLFGMAVYHPYRLTEFGKDIIKKLRENGYKGGSWEIWHDAKLYENEETFYLSPHIHLIMAGYVPRQFEETLHSEGFVLKKIRDVGFDSHSIGSLVGYLMTHAGYMGKSKSYRYIGLKRGVSVAVETTWSQPQKVLCPVCGEPMKEYLVQPDGSLVDNGYSVECHLIYRSYLVIDKKPKPGTAKYSQYVRIVEQYKKIVNKEEEKIKCTRAMHTMLFA